MAHIIRFIRILHPRNSDTFDMFYFRLSPVDYITGFIPVLKELWDITR